MKNIDFTHNYILNPEYLLYPDISRAILTQKNADSKEPFFVFIHPILAMMLSFFSGEKKLGEIIEEVSHTFSVSKETVFSTIEPLLENHKQIAIKYDDAIFQFPANVLINNRQEQVRKDLNIIDYIIKRPFDFKTKRFFIPKSILLVLNTQCFTDCIYCYADRKTGYDPMPLDKILDLIDEAVDLRVNNFDISGGEIFLHSDWAKILKKVIDNGFDPYISTKFPLTKDMISQLYDTGLRSIQISLDSINPDLLQNTLKVGADYGRKIKETISELNKKGFEITLKSTVTKITCTVQNVKEILDFAATIDGVKLYTFTPTGYSHYKSIEEFNTIKPSIEQAKEVSDFLERQANIMNFEINNDDGSVSDGSECGNNNAFKKRSLCTGNQDGVIVLPDGKITICEELYWNHNFIIGDLMNNSLQEIWSSEKATNLWNLKQCDFPEDSACENCSDFETCRHGLGVCWKDIIAVYGKENWLFPDPRCPKAPKPINPVYYDNSFISRV